MSDGFERRAAISGTWQSQVGRRLGRDAMELTLDACLEAIADAGLDRSDIDGVATYPGGSRRRSARRLPAARARLTPMRRKFR